MSSIFSHLELKGRVIETLEAASDDEVESLFAKIIPVDASVQQSDTQKKNLNKRKLQDYINHCCVQRQYFFSIRKCGSATCDTNTTSGHVAMCVAGLVNLSKSQTRPSANINRFTQYAVSGHTEHTRGPRFVGRKLESLTLLLCHVCFPLQTISVDNACVIVKFWLKCKKTYEGGDEKIYW